MKTRFYLLFILITILLVVTGYFLSGDDGYFTRMIILSGTLILASISILSFSIASRSIDSENPNRFVRGVMGGTFLKFFLCIIAVAVLIVLTKKKLHKPDLFLLMFEYVVFTVIETTALFTLSRSRK